MMNLDVPIWQLTARQFLELTSGSKLAEEKQESKIDKNLIYGIAGLSNLLGCSVPTAQRIKDSGKIPYTQIGRKIIFDADAVLTALNKKGVKAHG